MESWREIGDRRGQASILTGFGVVEYLQGDCSQARFMGIRADPDGQLNLDDVHRVIQHGAAVVRIRLTD
jgi:hypothetical protein